MGRGVVLAQIPKKVAKSTVSYKADPAQVDDVDRVVQHEGGVDAVSRSEVLEFLVWLGLSGYWAREEGGVERFRAVTAACGGDERRALKELLRRGLESWEKDLGQQKKPSR
jgi:hypothetical protein